MIPTHSSTPRPVPTPHRRQFLVTTPEHAAFHGWPTHRFGDLVVHAHPDLAVHVARDGATEAVLIGFAIDPDDVGATDADVLGRLVVAASDEDREAVLAGLSGRFVLGVASSGRTVFYPDASALRTLVYRTTGSFAAASDPALLARALGIEDPERRRAYARSRHFRVDPEHWLPARDTLVAGIDQLVANHVLDVGSRQQRRFWPTVPLAVVTDAAEIEEHAVRVARILRDSVTAASHRSRLALPVTAGIDSRTVFAALRATGTDHHPYTCLYRWLTVRSADVAIPERLYGRGRVQRVRVPRRVPADWARTYCAHTAQAHLDDAGRIAFGMHRALPDDVLVLSGTAAETARGFFHHDGPPRIGSVDDLTALVPGWADLRFIHASLADWLAETGPLAEALGHDLSSLFYWEHRAGSWQAQSQTEWDLVHDAFTPFSNRVLLETMLAVPIAMRTGAERPFLERILALLHPPALAAPVNPVGREERLRSFVWRAWRRAWRGPGSRRRARHIGA